MEMEGRTSLSQVHSQHCFYVFLVTFAHRNINGKNIRVFHAYIIHQKARERGTVIVKEPYSLDEKYGKDRLAVLQIVRKQFIYMNFEIFNYMNF